MQTEEQKKKKKQGRPRNEASYVLHMHMYMNQGLHEILPAGLGLLTPPTGWWDMDRT